ncbi:MAG: glycosyltransferase family 4 protein [Odoribacter sp.]|nr:glycosyltransferase family 4 protein [Odoribacter sp.]
MKIKIAYCIPGLYYPSGMERVLSLKANYLSSQKDKYEIYIILTEGKDKTPYYPLLPEIQLIHLDINFDDLYTVSPIKKISGYLQKQKLFRKRLTECLHQIRPDITISLLRRDINFINKIKDGSIKLGEIHFSRANYRDFKNNRLPSFLQKIVAKYWTKQLIRELKKLKRFIVLSQEDKAKWKELNNVSVLYNPLSFFPETTSRCENKKVIAVGRYMPQKGFDLLIDCWKIVSEKHPDWILSIYGDGMRQELQEQINRLGLQHQCRLEHSVSNITEKYLESSIFVLSSRYEGFGMVIIEAMACGLPTVSFACPCGPKDIIKDGKDGFLVENSDIEQMAEKICHLIEHEDERKCMGKNARLNVERFKIENIGPQWEKLFEEVLK